MKRALLLVVAAAALVATAFVIWSRTGGETLVLKKVLIDVDPAAVASSVDREAVRRIVADALGSARSVEVNEAGLSGEVLRVRVESFSQSAGGGVDDAGEAIAAGSTLSLSVEILAEGSANGARGHSVASAQGVMAPDALVSQAFKDALRQIQQARAADALDSEVLLSWLADPSTSTSQQQRAMQALASRGDRRATPAIVAALNRGPADVSVIALQALTNLADPEAVDAIIAYSDRQPNLVRKQCIDAVRASGAVEAAPWLFTLSTGHKDQDVQTYAKAALDALVPPGTLAAAGGLTNPDSASGPQGG